MQALDQLHPRSLKQLSFHLQSLVHERLWLKVLIGMFAGTVVGIILGPSVGWLSAETSATVGNWLSLPSQLFLAVVHMIVVPLVVASVIRGLASTQDVGQLKRLGLRTAAFFLVTTIVAIAIGVGMAYWLQPGNLIDPAQVRQALSGNLVSTQGIDTVPLAPDLETLPDTLIGLLPKNPLGAMVNDEMLGVVVFSVLAGVALVSMDAEQAKPMLDLLGSLQEICMTLVRWAMVLAPYAVFGSMARLTTQLGFEALVGMSAYVATVLAGLLVLLAGYLSLVALATDWRPLAFLSAVRDVQLLAFSTSSSATVMPLSMRTAEEKLGVRPSISQFVIPLGATINMNGTALYQAVAAVFLAQAFGIDLSFGALLFLVVTTVGASVGSSATPGVGIVILAMVLSSIGVPTAAIALILAVDRILDMSRTAINVTGDLVATLVLHCWMTHPTTAAEEFAREDQLDEQREATGEDVIVHDPAEAT